MINITGRKLDTINQTLQKQNEILAAMNRPESPALRVLAMIGSVMGILASVQFVDIVLKWFGRG